MKNNRMIRFCGSRKTICAVSAAGLVLLVVLAVVFLPTFVRRFGGDGGGLRNPETTQTQQSPDPILEGLPGVASDGTYRLLSAEENTALYALPAASSLYLQTDASISAETVAAAVRLSPQVPVSVQSVSDGVFEITPTAGMWSEGTLYRLALEENGGTLCSFAFQTARPLTVTSTYPANESVGVPTDTGIEITFSERVRGADFASYITVTPEITGAFEVYPSGKTVVLIPDQPLEDATQYAVTVKEGLTSDNGTVLDEDRIFCFLTGDKESQDSKEQALLLSLSDKDLVFSPGKTPVLSYSASLRRYTEHSMSMSPVHAYVRLYRYSSVEEAYAAMRNYMKNSEGELPADRALTLIYEGEVATTVDYSWSTAEGGWIDLPSLEEGVYLVEVTAKTTLSQKSYESTAHTFLQITPLRAYTESADGETLVWVHRTDLDTQTASGAEIRAEVFERTPWMTPEQVKDGRDAMFCAVTTAGTDDNGIAVLQTGDKNGALMQIRHDLHTLIVCASTAETDDTSVLRGYIYTDRSVYFANDTVRFFGFLGKSDPTQTLPSELTLRVGAVEQPISVEVARDGTFSGSFAVENWTSRYLSYSLLDGDQSIIHDSVRITQEEKPLYQMSVSFDRLFYCYGDMAEVTVKTSYFDTTPAAGLSVSLSLPNGMTEDVMTDENGEATVRFRMQHVRTYTYSTDAYSVYVQAWLMGYETVTLTDSASAYYFHASAAVEAERVDHASSKISLYELDTSRLLKEDDFSYANGYRENTFGSPLTDTLSVELMKTEFIKEYVGTSYDPINKVTTQNYRYRSEESVVSSYRTTAEGGVLLLAHKDASDFNGYYTYIVTWDDPVSGHTYRYSLYANLGEQRQDADYQPNDAYRLVTQESPALHGDIVSVSLYYGEKRVEGEVPQVLFTQYIGTEGRVAEKVICDAMIADYSFTFEDIHALGTCILATVFDGERYIQCQQLPIVYDYVKANSATITVRPDKETYLPGEDAYITVNSPDLSGGHVLISMVDEACFALGENPCAPLASYFTSAGIGSSIGKEEFFYITEDYIQNIDRYFSGYRINIVRNGRFRVTDLGFMTNRFYNAADDMLGAEVEEAPAEDSSNTAGDKGNGTTSDVYVRESFLDNAVFTVVSLDENGNGSALVRVPDNITTWRITAIGVAGVGENADPQKLTENVRIGTAVSEAVCTLPFFVNVTLPDLFLTADDIAFSVRCAGTQRSMDPTAEVSYSAVLYDEAGKQIDSASHTAAAAETAWFSFDNLPIGEYTLEVIGRMGEYSADAVRRTFVVVERAQIVDAAITVAPDQIKTLSPRTFPLTLTFRDDTDQTFFAVIRRLRYAYSSRTESLAASYAAQKLQLQYLPSERPWYSDDTTGEIVNTLSSYYGLIPLNSYAEGDAILTAELLYCVPNVLSDQKKSTLAPCFYEVLADVSSTQEEICASLMGLAMLGEPVLDVLYDVAAYAGGASVDVKLYLAAAFSAIGDRASAQIIWSRTKAEIGQTRDDGAFCLYNASAEETLRLTALALLPASVLDPSCAEAMVQYIDNHTSRVETYDLALAAYLTYYRPESENETRIVYTLYGEDREIVIRRGASHTVCLTKSDFESFTLVSADDTVAVEACFGAMPSDSVSALREDPVLTLEKKIVPYDQKNGVYAVIIRYSGTTDADGLSYTISETIPSGARYLGRLYHYPEYSVGYSNDNCYGYLSNDGSQQMHGSLYVYRPYKYNTDVFSGIQTYTFSGEIAYLIRGAVKGTFLSEPTLAIAHSRGVYAASAAYDVTIDDAAWQIVLHP